MINKHDPTQTAGGASPQKKTLDKVILEKFDQDDKEFKNFGFIESHDVEGNGPVFELQDKVTLLGKRVKAVLVLQTLKDIRRLDSSLVALTNKVGFNGLDEAPRSVMDHVESLLTHVKKVDIKFVAVETKVDAAAVVSQVGVKCDATVN